MSSIGIISPEARWETSKYGAAIRPAVATMLADKPSPPLPLGLDPHFDDLVAASRSRATWQKYECGWRAFQQFELRVGGKFAWPLDVGAVRGFITWCTFERKIKPDTIKTYLSALSMAHKLKGLAHPPSLDDELSKLALDGAARIPTAAPPHHPRPGRRVMTLPLLKVLGHNLAASGWQKGNIQTVWTASTLGFFSSARMGEILSKEEKGFDPSSTLTWADIKAREDGSFLIHIKNPKSGRKGGEYVDIFPFEGHGVCPAAALNRHMQMQKEAGLYNPSMPVFRFSSGKNLTPSTMNTILGNMLGGVLDQTRDKITCHSFRAAVASVLNRFPHLASSEDIKGWGRWESACYLKYARLDLEKKRAIFNKIKAAFNAS
jgi:hypothetical protein